MKTAITICLLACLLGCSQSPEEAEVKRLRAYYESIQPRPPTFAERRDRLKTQRDDLQFRIDHRLEMIGRVKLQEMELLQHWLSITPDLRQWYDSNSVWPDYRRSMLLPTEAQIRSMLTNEAIYP